MQSQKRSLTSSHNISSGKYLYIEASYPRKPGDKARIETKDIFFGDKSCVKFYYHMYGKQMGTLNVYSRGGRVFSASGNQGNKWHKAEVLIEQQRGVYPVHKVYRIGVWICMVLIQKNSFCLT